MRFGAAVVFVLVSRDGLRFYWLCRVGEAYEGELHLASRTDRTAPFTISAQTLGSVGIMFSLSMDELRLVSLAPDPDAAEADAVTIVHYERQSVGDAFSSPKVIVDTSLVVSHPEFGPDGLTLFGSVREPTALFSGLGVAPWNAAAGKFQSFTVDGMPVPGEGQNDVGPTLSNDCKRVYFVRTDGLRRAMLVATRE